VTRAKYYIIVAHTIPINECVLVIGMHQIKYGGECVVILEFNKGIARNPLTPQFNNNTPNLLRSHHKRPMKPNKNKVVLLHRILWNKVEKTNAKGAMGFIKKRIVLIHLKPPPPTLTLANHYKVYGHDVNHCFTLHLEFSKVNHKQPMWGNIRVLKNGKKRKA